MKKTSGAVENLNSSHQLYIPAKKNEENNFMSSTWLLPKHMPATISQKYVSFQRLPLELAHNRFLKRGVDILVSFLVIICILSWLIPILAILIKADSKGPVFFLQKRNKKNGKVFICLKFRSMIVNENADLVPAEKNDERVTFIGKFLRKNHLDELLQFFNVLMGDMSIVGPRPHMISDNFRYYECVDNYDKRLRVKPGITGLAQVMGFTGPVEDIYEMKKRVDMDNFYIMHWSLKLDMIVMYQTVFKTFG
jgi:putative colanic acid biosysnthesis UDP-glucose lipid carrier transferase